MWQHMSASPRKQTMSRPSCQVRFVPLTDILRRSNLQRYSITSSAIASSAGGTVSPSPLAALALMTRVDCYAPSWPLLEVERTSAMRFTSQALG
jgi:hypothetical protein